MNSLSVPPARVKPSKPLLPVSVVAHFVAEPTDEDLLIGAAVLEIVDDREMSSYWLQANTERGNIVGWSLRKFGSGEVYHLPRDLSSCECGDAVYRSERPGGCRHQQAIRQALTARPNVVA